MALLTNFVNTNPLNHPELPNKFDDIPNDKEQNGNLQRPPIFHEVPKNGFDWFLMPSIILDVLDRTKP